MADGSQAHHHPDWLWPDTLGPGVGAVMTSRRGGVSLPPWDSMNLGTAVGDDAQAVSANQQRLARCWGAASVTPVRQVHGARVLRLSRALAQTAAHQAATGWPAAAEEADAVFTTEPGVVCLVTVADCLPALMAAPGGRAVAAAHAGWRGLAGGVLENTLAAVCEAADCRPDEVRVWFGACIGPSRFEVGADVLQAFGVAPEAAGPRFAAQAPVAVGDRPVAQKWLADLAGLAADRLAQAGVQLLSGGRWCTASAPSRFFSYRRDGRTGRMAAAIWRQA